MEYWRKVKGYEGYEVSNRGRVRRSEYFAWYQLKNGKTGQVYIPEVFLPIYRSKRGTDYVALGVKHVRKPVADIQAEAFRGIEI